MDNRRKEVGTNRGRARKTSLLEREESSLREEKLKKFENWWIRELDSGEFQGTVIEACTVRSSKLEKIPLLKEKEATWKKDIFQMPGRKKREWNRKIEGENKHRNRI